MRSSESRDYTRNDAAIMITAAQHTHTHARKHTQEHNTDIAQRYGRVEYESRGRYGEECTRDNTVRTRARMSSSVGRARENGHFSARALYICVHTRAGRVHVWLCVVSEHASAECVIEEAAQKCVHACVCM